MLVEELSAETRLDRRAEEPDGVRVRRVVWDRR
jgi:hypothetical protein